MKLTANRTKHLTKSRRRLVATAIVVASVVFAIGAMTVLSRGRDAEAKSTRAKNLETNTRAAAQDVHLDAQDVEQQDISAEDAQKLGAGLKDLVNQSTDGLVEVQHADGSVSMDLEGRFQSVTVARINKDGSVTQSCVDNPRAAAAFLGIDPKLIDNTIESSGAKPIKSGPASN